jgi:hypothetical protein
MNDAHVADRPISDLPAGSVTARYTRRALLWLTITTTVYLLLNGAQIFETAVIVPNWTAAPPESLYLLQGKYGLDFKNFWIIFHSLHELTFITALILCWKIKTVRRWLILLLVLHIGVRIWTLTYFAPNIIAFQEMPASPTVNQSLLDRANEWALLNYIRVGVYLAISLAFIPLVRRTARSLNTPAATT